MPEVTGAERDRWHARHLTSLRSVVRMMDIAVEVKGLTREYRHKTALNGVDLSVATGETVGILGSNGAGKSTLVETIAGLRRPSAGSARVFGLDPWRDRARVRGVLGVQLQEAQFHSDLTVAENIRLHRSFYREGERPEELMEKLGLVASARVRTQHLSGGQAQRLSVAVALVGRPRMVILDELTTGLDPEGRRDIWRLIELMHQRGVTVLLVSHSMDEVERLCDRVVMLDGGRVAIEGTPADLMTRTGSENLEDAFLRVRERTSTRRTS